MVSAIIQSYRDTPAKIADVNSLPAQSYGQDQQNRKQVIAFSAEKKPTILNFVALPVQPYITIIFFQSASKKIGAANTVKLQFHADAAFATTVTQVW
jgi:hypothetical protein